MQKTMQIQRVLVSKAFFSVSKGQAEGGMRHSGEEKKKMVAA